MYKPEKKRTGPKARKMEKGEREISKEMGIQFFSFLPFACEAIPFPTLP